MAKEKSSKEVREQASSAEVSINAKGDPAFKVKLYFDKDTEKVKDIIEKAEDLMGKLREKF